MGRSSTVEEIAIAQKAGGRERRKQHRFACAGPAEVLAIESRSFYRGEIKDLSLTGCYVLTGTARLELDRLADVQLCLCVNGDLLDTPARVVMVRPESGAAFQFLPVDPEIRAALLTLIQKLNAQAMAPDSSL
jgi:c-di-GMP-binding flagellar brake protein YcgR